MILKKQSSESRLEFKRGGRLCKLLRKTETPDTGLSEAERCFLNTRFCPSPNYNIGVGGKKNELAPLVVTAEEAANMLRISKPKMYNLTRRADFPTLRIGSKVLIPIEKLKEWVNTHSLADEELIGA